MRVLRLLRGMVMTALTWAVVWVPLSLIPVGLRALAGAPLGMSVVRYMIIQAIFGAVNGAVFAGILAVAGRRKTFETIRLPWIAACGAVGAALIPFAIRVVLAARFDLPLSAIVSGLVTSAALGAGLATLTFSLARRAPELPRPDDVTPPPIGAGVS